MKDQRAAPVVLSRTVLATAIAVLLSGPVSAADPGSTSTQYDSAVTYAAYGEQQGSYKLRASDLIGRDVHDANDDEIGEIDDLIVSRDGDKVMAVISLGGFMGVGSKLVAIPYQDLRVTLDGKHVYYDATKDELKGRSEFTYADGERRVKTQPVNARVSGGEGRQTGIVVAGDVNPPGDATTRVMSERTATGESKRADNSKHNAGDVAGRDLTPFDQSNTDVDVDLTRSIRKALVDDDSLGTNAQNVKVITVDGTVTLRGAVENAEQQDRVVAIAKQHAGQARVMSELQVIKR